MFVPSLASELGNQLQGIRDAGTWKEERLIDSPQGTRVRLEDGREVLIFCANNYLGLAQHPEVTAAAHEALDRWGYGMASVRFICGTQTLHRELERKISEFLGTEDTILYSSCFDANGGLFETILTAEDAIISDSLNHASIIDGVRLCKAQRFRYANNNMDDLEAQLRAASGARHRAIITDGVFSMDGYIANLQGVCDLAEKYGALVCVDDCHATGFIGATGRGTHEHCGVMGRVDVLTGTLGKAIGGASGGYTSGPKEIIAMLRQRSRPYLFSNTLCPSIVGGTMKSIELMTRDTSLRDQLESNTQYFRAQMEALGFNLLPGVHPIVPIMLGDAALATKFADRMLDRGVYVVGFSFPVVPREQARIRVQISAAHSRNDLDFAIAAFKATGQELGLLEG
jgi:glycine C-acetyltransferase